MSGELRPQYPILFDGEPIPTFAQLVNEVLNAPTPDPLNGPFRVDYVGPYPREISPIAICTSRNAGYGLRAVAISEGINGEDNKPPRRGLYIVTIKSSGENVVLTSNAEPTIWNQRDSYYLTQVNPSRVYHAIDPGLGAKYVRELISNGVDVRHIPDGMGFPSIIARAFPDLFTPFQRD